MLSLDTIALFSGLIHNKHNKARLTAMSCSTPIRAVTVQIVVWTTVWVRKGKLLTLSVTGAERLHEQIRSWTLIQQAPAFVVQDYPAHTAQ